MSYKYSKKLRNLNIKHTIIIKTKVDCPFSMTKNQVQIHETQKNHVEKKLKRHGVNPFIARANFISFWAQRG